MWLSAEVLQVVRPGEGDLVKRKAPLKRGRRNPDEDRGGPAVPRVHHRAAVRGHRQAVPGVEMDPHHVIERQGPQPWGWTSGTRAGAMPVNARDHAQHSLDAVTPLRRR